MTPTRQGSFRLFRLAGIDVFLHWSWFLVAAYEISTRTGNYTSPVWNVLEYLALFLIVLMHEFGHALACRQVGGQANQIVLWPLGGVAYVAPPQRPGAMLWSIAAGPLVNVVLTPILGVLFLLSGSWGGSPFLNDARSFVEIVFFANCFLLVFNLLPVYPLDGGQILRSLLWFGLGRARSLMVASVIGFVGVAGVGMWALLAQSIWLGILAAFILLNCWSGFQQARLMMRLSAGPRRSGFACPACKQPPVIGAFWVCGECRQPFDTFAAQATCPHCGAQYAVTTCLDCGEAHPFLEWIAAPPVLVQSTWTR